MNCLICKKRISGIYYKDWAENVVCNHCYGLVDRCVSCGQFCEKNACEIDNGLKICAHCRQYYTRKSDVKRLIHYINSIYEREGLGRIGNWHLKGADAKTLFSMTGVSDTRGLAYREGRVYTIFVYRHLSRTAFTEVLSHEMLHIWQYERDIQADDILVEGFCNLGSYVVLNKIGTPKAFSFIRTMNEDDDPIYGEGFRIMRYI